MGVRDELTEAFAAVVTAPVVELDRAAVLIAAHADPAIDVDAELVRLDDLAARCGASLDEVMYQLFVVEGLHGNETAYYEPENSFLPSVLDRRTGIPISLTVVLIEVARRCGVLVEPLATPGHFTALHVEGGRERFIDAFAGVAVEWDDFERLFPSLPPSVELRDYCTPISAALTLGRMLMNLTSIYRERGSRSDLVWVTELRSILPCAGTADRLDRVSALAGVGDYARAAKALDAVLEDDDGIVDREGLVAQADRLRARLN